MWTALDPQTIQEGTTFYPYYTLAPSQLLPLESVDVPLNDQIVLVEYLRTDWGELYAIVRLRSGARKWYKSSELVAPQRSLGLGILVGILGLGILGLVVYRRRKR
jgi:hypothetical protein